MGVGEFSKGLVMIVLFISIGVGGYVWSRYREASEFQKGHGLKTFDDTKKFRPVICEMSAADFRHALRGQMYVANGFVRADYIYTESGSIFMHVIIQPDGVSYAWKDGSDRGFTVTGGFTAMKKDGGFNKALQHVNCAPWWWPYISLFEIPDTVNFKNFSSSTIDI